MLRLSVNVNKIATLRNARGGNLPDLLGVSRDILRFGAQGLTVHPRPDERHIRATDLAPLRALCREAGVAFNMEGYPTKRFISLLKSHRPDQATLVPDAPTAQTSDAGWQLEKAETWLAPVLAALSADGLRVALFIDPVPEAVRLAAQLGAHAVELYTGPYATQMAQGIDPAQALLPYVQSAKEAKKHRLDVHAGHDLSLRNLAPLVCAIPFLSEVSIGHALVCESLYAGLQHTIVSYLGCIKDALSQHASHV